MAASSSTSGVILFDGTCAFCERAVTFIADRDPAGYFRFGASQSPEGARLLAAHGLTRELAQSIVLIEGERLYLRSTASLRIAARLPLPWSLARFLLAVPSPVRDLAYRGLAAIRHRLAGRSNACAVPPPAIRSRLI